MNYFIASLCMYHRGHLVQYELFYCQFVFVSLGASRPPRKQDGSVSVSYLSPPDRSKLPMMLLLQESHFSRLFNLLQQLSNFKPCVSGVVRRLFI